MRDLQSSHCNSTGHGLQGRAACGGAFFSSCQEKESVLIHNCVIMHENRTLYIWCLRGLASIAGAIFFLPSEWFRFLLPSPPATSSQSRFWSPSYPSTRGKRIFSNFRVTACLLLRCECHSLVCRARASVADNVMERTYVQDIRTIVALFVCSGFAYGFIGLERR